MFRLVAILLMVAALAGCTASGQPIPRSAVIQIADKQYYGELQNARTENRRITDELATARERLSVRVDPSSCSSMSTTAGAASMDDEVGARADLHPATAAGVFGVAGRADECQVKLRGLQEWVQLVVAP